MGNLKFSLSMLKKEYKHGVIYSLTLAFTTAIIFLFFNIIENPYLLEIEESGVQWYNTAMNFSTMLAFLIVCFCAFMIIFAYNFYVSRKTKEIAIMTMSGSSYLKVTAYLVYQTGVMSIFAFVIGLLLGYGMIIVVNQYIYVLIHTTGPMYYVPPRAIIDAIACVCAIMFAEIMYISGYVYRKDISYMLSQETRNKGEDQRIFKFPPIAYFGLYVFGIVAMLMDYSPVSAIFPSLIGSVAIGGMIKYFFPIVLKAIKERWLLSNKTLLISLSNLYYSLARSSMLIGVYAVSITTLNCILITQKNSPREFITTLIGFVVITVLILLSIVYKYCLEASTRKRLYQNLYKIGFTGIQIKRIIKIEVILYYITIFILPMVFIIISLFQALYYFAVTIDLIIAIVLFQAIMIIIACLITYYTYKKEVVLKGGLING